MGTKQMLERLLENSHITVFDKEKASSQRKRLGNVTGSDARLSYDEQITGVACFRVHCRVVSNKQS